MEFLGPIGRFGDVRQPQTQPIEMTTRRENLVRSDGRIGRCVPAQLLDRLAGRADEQERVARAGQRDIQQAQFFTAQFALFVLSRAPMRETGITLLRAGRRDLRAQAKRFVKEHRRAEMLFIETRAQSGHGDDGKLQSFTAVNTQQSHHLARGGRGGFKIQFFILLQPHKAQKAIQTLALVGIELSREIEQAAHVRETFGAARFGLQQRFVVRVEQGGFQRLRQGRLTGEFAPPLELFDEQDGFRANGGWKVSAAVRHPNERVPQQIAPFTQTDFDQFIQ